MNSAVFIKKIFLSSFVILVLTGHLATPLFAQSTILFNNGAEVYTDPTALLHLNGGFQNDNSLATPNVFENNGTMTIASIPGLPGSVFLTNNSTLRGNGIYFVEQDWTNDAVFIPENSTVNFNGNLQEFITSTNSTITTFNNLVLTGIGSGNNRKKTLQLIDAKIGLNGTLAINDRELETATNTMFVLNPSLTCVTNNAIPGSEGFVSSSFNSGGSGSLSRVTNTSSAYLYPTGSSIGTTRYRPVLLTPASGTANTYTARLGNNTATADGFNTAALDTTMCSVNPLFYHEITHSSGNDNSNIEIFYDQTSDGGWDGMAKWNSTSPGIWNNMGTVTATANIPFSSISKPNWADFSFSPYILSRTKPVKPILNCASVCVNSNGNTFSAEGTGSSYNWTSPAGTTIVSGQNTNSVTIAWDSLPGPVTVSTSSLLGCTSAVASCIVNPSPLPIAAFTSTPTGLAYDFTDLSLGGVTQWQWDFGDGSLLNIQNPSHTFLSDAGPYTIMLIASTQNNCIDTAYQTIVMEQEQGFSFYIPDAFSPNNDGINDTFSGKGVLISKYEMMIFDRWGNLIFFSDDFSKPWDGRANHGTQIVQEDVYIYSIKVTDVKKKKHNYKGIVTLFR